jgi:uncharacterized protein YuzE
MRIEYDPKNDLLYVWFAPKGTNSSRTETLAPGVFADFDGDNRLIAIEVIEATSVIGTNPQVEVPLGPAR